MTSSPPRSLVKLTDACWLHVLGVWPPGDRRRLATTLRRLANRGGFPPPLNTQPGALGWSADRATQWLQEEGLGDLAAQFAEHGIDGECLLKLQPDDLKVLGATTLGQQSNLKRRLDRLRKLTYAGQMVGPEAAAVAPAAVGEAGGQIRTVLAAVLDDNAALQDRIQQLQDRPAAEGVPDEYLCPILGDLMDDPVIAMDGHTVSWNRGSLVPFRGLGATVLAPPKADMPVDQASSSHLTLLPSAPRLACPAWTTFVAVRARGHRNLVPAVGPEPDDQPTHPPDLDPQHPRTSTDRCAGRRRSGGGRQLSPPHTSPHLLVQTVVGLATDLQR